MKNIAIKLAILVSLEGLPITARMPAMEGIADIFRNEGFEVTINDGVIDAVVREEVSDEDYEKVIEDLTTPDAVFPESPITDNLT